MNAQMWKYLRGDKRTVAGWLLRTDAEIIGCLLEHQAAAGITGSVVEIGIHHGKSFIPLCMALRKEELALAIDLFDKQDQNIDQSGLGDLATFTGNLERFRIDRSRVRIFKDSSENVTAEQIVDAVGRARFFSVDGGHWESIVTSDLRLAELSLADGGVIALDDFFRAEWPEVTAGYYRWRQSSVSQLVPFAVSSNKLFICHMDLAKQYRDALLTPRLRPFRSKTYNSSLGNIDCYRVEPSRQDEEPLTGVISYALKIFRPELWMHLRNTLRHQA